MPESLMQLRRGRPLARQLPVAAAAAAAALLVLAAFALLAALVDQPLGLFSRDPGATLGGPAYVGWLSHVGVVVWLVGATCSALAGAALHRAGAGRSARFLLAAGAYTGALALDDLFQLHEAVYPRLGVREELVYLAYAAALAVIVWRFAGEVARHGAVLLGLALLFTGGSMSLDGIQKHLQAHLGTHWHLLEDGSKLVGIALWSTFLVGASFRDLLQAVRSPAPSTAPVGAPERAEL